MNYKIIPEQSFLRAVKHLLKKYKSLKKDLAKLGDELHANPYAGADLGGGVRKVRMAITSKNKGKSHGARVITFAYAINEEEGTLVLLYIYDKEERDTISKEEIAKLVAQVQHEILNF